MPWTRLQGTSRGRRLSQAWPIGRNAMPSRVTVTSIHSMKKLWKSKPTLNASPHPMAIASAAKDPLWVSETSTTASTKPSAQAAIGTPGQRMTSRFSGLSGRKLMRAHKVSSAIKANISAITSLHRCFGGVTDPPRWPPPCGRRGPLILDVEFFDVEVAEFRRGLQPVVNQDSKQAQHVAGAVEVDAMLPRQGLDRLQLADVALGKTAAVGGGSLGNDQAQMLVHHQRSRMRLQNLRGNADGVDWLVEPEAPIGRRRARYSFSPTPIPSHRLGG